MQRKAKVLMGSICLSIAYCVLSIACPPIWRASCVYAAEETLILETYYPSPYGVYNELRLYPRNPAPTCSAEGVMFYDDTRDMLMVCTGSPTPIPVPASGLWMRAANNLYPLDNNWNVGIGTASAGTAKLAVMGGNVGIGNTNPARRLDVSGDGSFTGPLYLGTQGTSFGQAIHAGRSVNHGVGLSGGGQLTTDRIISLDTSSISGCTDATTNKIYWGGSRLVCGSDQTGGVGGGNITITAPGGSYTGSSFNFGGNVTYTGGNTFTFGGGGPGGSVFSLTGGSNVTLSGPGVNGNTWNPNTGSATISATGGGGGGGAVNPWFSPVIKGKNGGDLTVNLGSPGQFQFCALAYHWENTGGGGDDASCGVALSGSQWTLAVTTGTDADAKCQAICF